MNRSTRSKLTLSGSITDYILDTTVSTSDDMPDTPPPPHDAAQPEAQDLRSLLSTMIQTLSIVTEARNGTAGVNQNHTKLEDCPIKRKLSSLDAWVGEVLLWDESNTGSGDGWNGKKYLKFVDSVRKSEDCSDLQNLVQAEFVEKESFDKKADSVIKTIVKKIKEKLGQTDLEKCSDAWLAFINIKQEPEEAAKSFLSRFEKAETQLKNVKIDIPNKALAIHLINRSNMEEQSKENVLTKTNLDDDTEIYISMKKSIREMKGNLTANAKSSESQTENKTFYGRQE